MHVHNSIFSDEREGVGFPSRLNVDRQSGVLLCLDYNYNGNPKLNCFCSFFNSFGGRPTLLPDFYGVRDRMKGGRAN